ncbi:hypothetical protein [Longimicrobium terrae]|uniref:Uncharacterized protein n=1 Tax=Longimicrobium terrae TaxID=1639882 RepID=A0A841H1Q5_9BACT|nr:hypothetical protein [Longimicrobium terrae]MBB4637507.1 hypothetical protein [Longimicrobium terrae]MBB6071904.1 hypothetical protein [Longimicrobium terrae]
MRLSIPRDVLCVRVVSAENLLDVPQDKGIHSVEELTQGRFVV